MKIAQLTQPLHLNYGGILQTYALQAVLRDMGHEVVYIDRRSKEYEFSFQRTPLRILSMLKSIGKRCLLRKKEVGINNPFRVNYNAEPDYANYQEFLRTRQEFIQSHIISSEPIASTKALSQYIESHGFDAVIVGSDQVWRQEYSPCITDYFLAFIPKEARIKGIAYAASVGTDNLDIDAALLPTCGEGLRRFDAVSVREERAQELLASAFGVKSEVVLDPTMLVKPADWCKLIALSDREREVGLVHYVLDESDEKVAILEDIATRLHLERTALSLYPKSNNGQPCEQDGISVWLASLANARFVVTDSFHGCVFAILFNKPFVVIANKDRGLSRFQTLLGHFHLQERMVFTLEEYEKRRDELLTQTIPIDYVSVNQRLEELRTLSRKFLADVLAL